MLLLCFFLVLYGSYERNDKRKAPEYDQKPTERPTQNNCVQTPRQHRKKRRRNERCRDKRERFFPSNKTILGMDAQRDDRHWKKR